jgi:hypothetical protein
MLVFKDMHKKYEGVSLVEMLLTMVILSFVMILTGLLLTTLLTTSAVSKSRTMVRTDTEFILELLRRNVRNSQPQEINLFRISNRVFDVTNNRVISSTPNSEAGYEVPILEGDTGTELHFRPLGSEKWVCIGYFPDSNNSDLGYILQASTLNRTNPSDCFNSPTSYQSTLILNSEDTDVDYLNISFYYGVDDNIIYTIESSMKPRYWVGDKMGIKPEYTKQVVVSTQKLTWSN